LGLVLVEGSSPSTTPSTAAFVKLDTVHTNVRAVEPPIKYAAPTTGHQTLLRTPPFPPERQHTGDPAPHPAPPSRRVHRVRGRLLGHRREQRGRQVPLPVRRENDDDRIARVARAGGEGGGRDGGRAGRDADEQALAVASSRVLVMASSDVTWMTSSRKGTSIFWGGGEREGRRVEKRRANPSPPRCGPATGGRCTCGRRRRERGERGSRRESGESYFLFLCFSFYPRPSPLFPTPGP